MPDSVDDPTEAEFSGAADKMEMMMSSSQPNCNIFFLPDSLGALPTLWSQAKLTISLTSFQDKFARLFMTIAAEVWLRGCEENIDSGQKRHDPPSGEVGWVHMLAEEAGWVIGDPCDRMPRLWTTYWFWPILSELIGAATETVAINRERARDPVEVTVTTQPHSRPHAALLPPWPPFPCFCCLLAFQGIYGPWLS